MKYRQFGKLQWKTSSLGFGAMRLPFHGTNANIDEPEAIKMLRHGIDNGINYVDTAYGYHGGNSERVVGKALKDGYRQKVKLATKMPSWEVKTVDDFDRLCHEQLEKLQDDHIDMYLLHALNAEHWKRFKELDIFSWAEKAKKDGRISNFGFSFHDEYEVFEEIINDYEGWDFCQIQYNYMNEELQAGTKGLELAAGKQIAVIVMEPLLGGNLVSAPDAITNLWKSADVARSPAEWALQWLWNKPEVSMVLSGMSTFEQVQQNIDSAELSETHLSEDELDLVDQVRAMYAQIRPIPCTDCKYCMPCPSGVDIPRNLELYNIGSMYGVMDRQKETYQNMQADIKAAQCTQCLECEEKCPQKIIISEWMECIDSEMKV